MSEISALGYINHVVIGTLNASSAESSHPVANLKLPQCDTASAWQSADGVVTNVILTVTLNQADLIVRGIGIFRTNLTKAAVVTITGYQSPSTQVFQDVCEGPQPGFGQVVLVTLQDYTVDYVTIEVDDATNPDNHISVGGAFVGPLWFQQIGLSWSMSEDRPESIKEQTTRGGQEYVTFLFDQRAMNLAYEAIARSEVWDALDEARLVARYGHNILAIKDARSVDLYRESVFGRLKNKSAIGFSAHSEDTRSWTATVMERI